MPAIHHSVVVVRDLEQSLRFYRDGIGLTVLQDRVVEGDWPELLGASGRTLRAVFLGDPDAPDVENGVLELAVFDDVPHAEPQSGPRTGLFMLSYFADVEQTLARLKELGLGGEPRRVVRQTPVGTITLATVRDPDGVTILLTPGSITERR